MGKCTKAAKLRSHMETKLQISADGLMELKTDSKLSQQFQSGLSGFTLQNPLNVLTCALVAVRCIDVYSSSILNSLFKQD